MDRIAILDDYQGVALALAEWGSLADAEVVAFANHLDDVGALAERLAGFDIVVAMRERTAFPAELFAQLPRLRLLVSTGARNAAIDVAAAAASGVVVCGTRASQGSTPELTWGLIHAVVRGLPDEVAAVRNGGWQQGVGMELAGKTLGVIGLGRIGSRVARVGDAFGMNVIAWSQNLTAERAAECEAELVERDELFRRADVIAIHLVLSDRTRGLVGARELTLMKPTAFLINTSRGPIVDEPALVAALESGQIAGAGIDVFEPEPLPADHPFRRLRNVVATPHIGYVTEDTYRIFYADAVEDIAAFRRGEPLRVIEP